MRRLSRLAVAGAFAVVAVSLVAAGPAVAAKGGNSENAHACQQGGHENMFEAETGNPFKNAGDCTSHGAVGGVSASLEIQAYKALTPRVLPDTYPCDTGTCWGHVIGSGLQPGSGWSVLLDGLPIEGGVVGATGDLNEPTKLACDVQGVQATASTALGRSITSSPADPPFPC